MLLKLNDEYAIDLDSIACIMPYKKNSATIKLLKSVENGDEKGVIIDWTQGKKRDSIIVSRKDGYFILYLTNMSLKEINSLVERIQKKK